MISPEMIRRYPFFSFLNDTQVKAVAMSAEHANLQKGQVLTGVGTHGDALYLLANGSCELYYMIEAAEGNKSFYITDINPGEIFGFAAFFPEPVIDFTIKASSPCRTIKVSASGLMALCHVDDKLGYGLMHAVAQASLGRLNDVFVQLAAARAEVGAPAL